MSLYISGPMTGVPEFNFPAFDRMAEFLRDAGIEPISPADHDRRELARRFAEGETPYNHVEDVPGYAEGDVVRYSEHTGAVYDLLVWDFKEIVDGGGIVLLPGWETSTGAAHERYVAEATNKRIFLAEFHDDGSISMHRDEEPVRLTERPKYAQRVADKIAANIGNAWLEAQEYEEQAVSVDVTRIGNTEFITEADRERDTYTTAEKWHDGAVLVVDEKTGGAKGQKLARFDLVPADVMWEVAEHYGRGARKYADRNWEKGFAWSLAYAAALRHLALFWQGQDIDPDPSLLDDDGVARSLHLVAALWQLIALTAFTLRGIGTDDRPVRLPAVA